MTTLYKPHPLADLFPEMPEDEYEALRDDIKKYGQRDAILLANGQWILDGRHRYKACLELGISPRFRGVTGTDAELVALVVSHNLRRRHLSDRQRAMIAAEIATYAHGGNRKNQDANWRLENVNRATAAKLFDVSEKSVERAAQVVEHGTPELVQAVKQDKIAVSTAAAIAEAPKREQKQIVALDDEKQIVKRAKEINARKRAERAEMRRNDLIAKADTFMLEGPSHAADGIAIHNLDARNLLDVVAPDSAQLVITSPPYNCGMPYDAHDDNLPLNEYTDLLGSVFARCYAALCDGGRIAVVVPFGMQRTPWEPFAPRIHAILSECGFVSRGWIVWNKGTAGNSTAWGSFRSFTNPALRDEVECIIVMHKGSDTLPAASEQLQADAYGKFAPYLRDPNYFGELTQNVWNVQPETGLHGAHPAPFPVLIAQRLMHLYAPHGSLVLDPFAGSGTVGVAAKKNGYRAALLDVSPVYCALARERIEAAQ